MKWFFFRYNFEQFEMIFFSPELDLTFEDLETNSTASAN